MLDQERDVQGMLKPNWETAPLYSIPIRPSQILSFLFSTHVFSSFPPKRPPPRIPNRGDSTTPRVNGLEDEVAETKERASKSEGKTRIMIAVQGLQLMIDMFVPLADVEYVSRSNPFETDGGGGAKEVNQSTFVV
jgi:hypothetical protein